MIEPTVKEAPLLMTGPMVRATLDLTKTMTRRVVTECTSYSDMNPWGWVVEFKKL